MTLGDPLSTNLDARLAEGLDHGSTINTTEGSCFAREGVWAHIFTLRLVITTLGLEFYTAKGHDTSSQHVAVKLLLFSEAQHIEGILSVLQLFIVINRCNSGLTLGDISVVIDVCAKAAFLSQTSSNTISKGLEQLVKDMVGSFNLLLLSNTGFLQQVGHNITTSKLARGSEMDTDELSKSG